MHRLRLALAALVAHALAACADAPLPTDPRPPSPIERAPGLADMARHARADSASAVASRPWRQRVLERAADGLLYTSESDHPFTYVEHAAPGAWPLTPEAFRRARGLADDVPVEVVALDDFFRRHIEGVDPADARAVALVPRYVRLRETLRATTRAVRVYRVGRIAIDCWIVGAVPGGRMAGLTTVAIET